MTIESLLMSVYCIIKCPFCTNVQGGQFPVKKTICKLCSKTINLDKVGTMGTYQDLKEMQAVLISMKWEGEDPIIHNGIHPNNKMDHFNVSTKGRDALRRSLLKAIEEESSRDVVIQRMVCLGYEIDNIENVIEELMINGLIISPIYGKLKKA
jgi:hypothetical protein